MNKNITFLLVLVLFVAAGTWVYMMSIGRQETGDNIMKNDEVKTDSGMMIIQLSEQNDSGEMGTASLIEENGKVKVTLTMTGFQPNVSQPAHIHVGECPNVGVVKYPLTNVMNGQSVTMLDTTLAQIKTELPLGLNVHKSTSEASVYTACGDL